MEACFNLWHPETEQDCKIWVEWTEPDKGDRHTPPSESELYGVWWVDDKEQEDKELEIGELPQNLVDAIWEKIEEHVELKNTKPEE